MPVSSQARRLLTSALRPAAARSAAFRIAGAWRRDLVLVYHRVAPEGAAPHEIVRSLPSALFRRQLQALAEVGDIVPLTELLKAAVPARRPRFAITFDDDDIGHVRNALPVLQQLGAPATFFLSGRTLHNLPPYWWVILEHAIRSSGIDHTRRALGLASTPASRPSDLAVALEGTALSAEVATLLPLPEEPSMSAHEIRALVEAGMTVGFHTLYHPVLSLLEGIELETALTAGRRELAAVAGTPVDLLAYPYGRGNSRTAKAAEQAGFSAAWATGGRPITHRSDRFLLGRWEPDELLDDDFLAAVAVRLLRFPTAPQSSSSR